ncbi:MAG TPA: type II toxin-antitoxin system VapC family toxin [Solirubrobacteraceae bacterium]
MYVVDASVLVSYLAGAEYSSGARAALIEGERQGGLWAPHLIDAEVGHALRRAVLAGELGQRAAGSALTDLYEFPINRVSHLGLLKRAWAMRANLTFYDALYVTLAEQLQTALLTLDGRLSRAPGVEIVVQSLIPR